MVAGQRIYPDAEVKGTGGAVLRYQGDGNLVLYGPSGPLWATGTGGAPGYVEFQADANLVVYDAVGVPIWASGSSASEAVLRIELTGLRIVAATTIWRTPALALPPEPEPGEHPDPLLGPLRWDNGYRDDFGLRNVVGIHLGDLIGQGLKFGLPHILPALDFAQSKGMHTVRSWFQLYTEPGGWWDQWPASTWSPRDNPALFREILQAGADRGLKWVLSGGGIKGQTNREEDAEFAALNEAIADVGPQHVAMVEVLNEVLAGTGDQDDIDPRELERIIAPTRARFPGMLCALSATGGTEDRNLLRRYTPDWMRFYLIHGYRDGRAHDKIRHIFSMSNTGEGPTVRRHAWWNEPYGGGRLVSSTGNKHELTDHVMELSACMAVMCGGQWTVMSGPGVIYGTEPLAAMPGMNAPSVVRQLPQDLGRFDILGHSHERNRGQRIHAVRPDAPDVRADYAIDTRSGRYVEIIYGPPEQRHDLPKERITFGDRVMTQGPWGTVTAGNLS